MREVNGMREDHFFAEPIVESKGHKLAPSDTTLTIQSQNGPIKRSRFAGRGGGGFSDFFGVFHILCVAMGAAARLRCAPKRIRHAPTEVATPKAKDLEGRHRNFRTLVRIWESPRARNSRDRNRQELFGSLDPALTNLVHAASSVL